jgi:citrate lyase subunit beta / citryl-CoA lyase
VHPREVLYIDGRPLPALPPCEHFAGNEKFITKAFAQQSATAAQSTTGAKPRFDVICDLEDGTAAGEETRAAEMVADCLLSQSNAFGRAGVRIHDASHPHWMRDIDIVVGRAAHRLAYVTLPKCESRMDALKVASYIDHVLDEAYGERRAGNAHGKGVSTASPSEPKSLAPPQAPNFVPLHVLIETHQGLREVHDIAALPTVEGISLGIMDFVSGHHGAIAALAMSSPGQFDHPLIRRAKLEISAAALGNGAVPIHGITQEYKDLSVVKGDATRARSEFGYLRQYSIHPDQIAPIIEAMSPSPTELEDASAILLAAQAKGWGPVGYKAKLHDRASYRYYWQLLQRAHALGAALPQEATHAFFSAG